MINYGTKNYKNIQAVHECILIEKLNEETLRKSHGLYIPETAKFKNNKIGVGKIINIGSSAKSETNLNENDYVLYDYYSVFNDFGKFVITKYENIIMKMEENEAYKFLNGEI